MKYNLIIVKDQLGGVYTNPPIIRQYKSLDAALNAARRGGDRYSVSVHLNGRTYYLADADYRLFVSQGGWIRF